MTLLGGMGTAWGPVIGATFLTLVGEYLGTKFVYDYLILLGIVIILVILLLPRGMMQLLKLKRGGVR
jgi:branched-chain amino acid transport system permease protein